MSLNRIVPEEWPYEHDEEGADDMPAHVKTVLTGVSLSIPVMEGRMETGIWQGIYLMEHRDRAGGRTLVATIHGERYSQE